MEYEQMYQLETLKPKYECLLFDVDDTLYPFTSGLATECTKNITEFMINKLGIEGDKVPEMCVQLYKDYGTTMAGLQAIGYEFDYDEYHRFVHGRLPYENLKPDPVLRGLLHSLPIRKVIFSNANKVHVAEILRRLGLEDCFERIICFETLNPINKSNKSEALEDSDDSGKPNAELPQTKIICKPFAEAFEQAFKIADIDPKKTLFFDDSLRNLQTANKLGLDTVLIGSSHRTEGVGHALESIHNIREALPKLWETGSEAVNFSGEIAIETYVRA